MKYMSQFMRVRDFKKTKFFSNVCIILTRQVVANTKKAKILASLAPGGGKT